MRSGTADAIISLRPRRQHYKSAIKFINCFPRWCSVSMYIQYQACQSPAMWSAVSGCAKKCDNYIEA